MDGVGRVGRVGFGAGGVTGVGERAGVEVGLGDRMRTGADDRRARRERATGIVGTHENPVRAGVSDTDTLCNVMLPVFVAVNVYVTTWPTVS